jgi:hypothetical protein
LIRQLQDVKLELLKCYGIPEESRTELLGRKITEEDL